MEAKKPSKAALDRAIRRMIDETLEKTGQVVGKDGAFLDKGATDDPRHPAHRARKPKRAR